MQTAFYRALERTQRALAAAAPATPPDLAIAAQRALAALVAEHGEPRDWACRAGCAHCCHHPVGVTIAEAALLVAAIAGKDADARAELRARITAAARATAALPWAALDDHACPLLAHGECAVYAARPLACRAWASSSAFACAGAQAGDPAAVPFDRAA